MIPLPKARTALQHCTGGGLCPRRFVHICGKVHTNSQAATIVGPGALVPSNSNSVHEGRGGEGKKKKNNNKRKHTRRQTKCHPPPRGCTRVRLPNTLLEAGVTVMSPGTAAPESNPLPLATRGK